MREKKIPELLILIGPPGSGKSTLAKELLKKNTNYVRVNRDDTRLLLANSYTPDEDIENLVSKVQDSMIDSALRSGKSVVVDNTHCKLKYIKELITKFAAISSITYKFVDPQASLKELIARNDVREKKVPEEVIERMHKGFNQVIKAKADIQLHLEHVYGKGGVELFKQNDKLPRAILVDIDGTVAHMGDTRGPFEWHKVDRDEPDEHVLNIIRALSKNYNVVFMSGRDESCRDLTSQWLYAYYGNEQPVELYMRPANNYEKDNIVKTDLYNKHIKDKYYVEAVFDDRDQVVKMWRELGLKCFQVAYGNF